ncbi:MAG: hypothetical protein KTR15_01010 [Phycisphaeraceae bacterium]|nr:hypothetical protein [Phycisphaeraceae bacterium]
MKTLFYLSLVVLPLLFVGCHSDPKEESSDSLLDVRLETASSDSPDGPTVGVVYINDKPVMVHSSAPGLYKSQHRFYLKSAKEGSNILITTDHDQDEQLMFILDKNYAAKQVYLLVEQHAGRWQYQLQNDELSQHYCAKHVVVWGAATTGGTDKP